MVGAEALLAMERCIAPMKIDFGDDAGVPRSTRCCNRARDP